MDNQDRLKSIFRAKYKSLENVDEVLTELRNAGASQLQSTFMLIRELEMSLPEADNLVVNSSAWNDIKDEVDKLRDDIFDDLNNCRDAFD